MEKQTISNFANEVKSQLPQLLHDIVAQTSNDAEANMMLMGAITTISAALPNVYGVYDEKVVYPNLYLFVSAKASSGKGHLALCKYLTKPIHDALRGSVLLPNQSLFIPANSSATAIYQQLCVNNGVGLIFETEADSLNNAIRSSYGNFSDGLRKAFHHESISYLRRKDNEWVEIDSPHLSIVLSGTPLQCRRLMPNTENGLFSRFAIMHLPSDCEWKNVFRKTQKSKTEFYAMQGQRIYDLYKCLRCQESPIEFELTVAQESRFNSYFDGLQNKFADDENFIATIRRMGIISYRIAMVLSALRLKEELGSVGKIVCADADFDTALRISQSLIEHAYDFYCTLSENEDVRNIRAQKSQYKTQLLEMLPKEFSRKEVMNLSKSVNLTSRTIDNYIREFITDKQIECVAFGSYRKIS